MDTAKNEQFILRYGGDGEAPAKDVQLICHAQNIETLDVSPRMALVCGNVGEVEDLASQLDDWILSALSEVDLPDRKPRIKNKPASAPRSSPRSSPRPKTTAPQKAPGLRKA
ncbi:MAG TPA: hypothetical protein PLJ62_09210 [Thermoflexales bacterium]|nr:hypothetical protein [Thermoflexales bacterium]HQW34263.1 hypothetical protein [Thermoflexales bacterium]HQZ21424.1 hypothetical protein [Thermoflexales bacterium]HRA00363.1 hypothetical protein [Thermoflexales bacterium]